MQLRETRKPRNDNRSPAEVWDIIVRLNDRVGTDAARSVRVLHGQYNECQEGMVKMAVDRKTLQQCFPSQKLSIGKLGWRFSNAQSWHWVVTYENKKATP